MDEIFRNLSLQKANKIPLSIPSFVQTALPKLPLHLPTIVRSALLFWAIQTLSKVVSPKLSRTYRTLGSKVANRWDAKVVSLSHALLIVPLAWSVLYEPALVADEVFGYSYKASQVVAIAVGSFIWDTIDSALNSTIGFVVHGAACLAVFSLSYRPFLGYYGPRFLMWELSTPLLNLHWFLEKTNRSGSPLMILNALLLMAVFFSVRIVYGLYMSYNFFEALLSQWDEIPLVMHVVYMSGNIALNGLNLFWFTQMVKGMARRLRGERKDASTNGKKVKSN
ncbi:DUF887-domain-containing protein [Mrakia frigida]|uniref:TLC domain-containing protein n=1 Tax=Mrakia frigida TaxID=29902 RepID=UPI003FCC1D3C